MTARPAIQLDFEDGIDRKTLKALRQRFERINDQRLARACDALGPRQRLVLDLLPLAVHLNHPALPGYLDAACPCGLARYTPTSTTLEAAQRHSRSFRWQPHIKQRPQLDALFAMGSPGTIAHTGSSDLDVWLCHKDDLDEWSVRLLQRKADALTQWAQSQGVELHIFVLCARGFREGRLDQAADEENCGSAQHYLLLDEFYRTSIFLGGRYPLWWMIPADREDDYQQLTRQLLDFRFIRDDEAIDFGPIPTIPDSEFVGAGIWQLYKGIDAPWKAILKLFLIESYAQEKQSPLALAYKAAIFAGVTDMDLLDPYVMLCRHLEHWLEVSGEQERLELVRRSLYLKAALPLSRVERPKADWRSRLLLDLVQSWGWQPEQWRDLDQRHRWRVGEVMRERRTIVNALTHSYRFLTRLARERRVQASISSGDLTLLGRKLYAAFQRKAGKIELINPGIAPNLFEENLALHHRSAQPGTPRGSGWLLYRDLESPSDATFKPVIKHSASLIEMLTWCHCNGLLTSTTRLNLQAGNTHTAMPELRALINALQHSLPSPVPAPVREALADEPRSLKSLLFVNVGLDPLESLSERGLQKLSARHDALGFSGVRDNLVLTLDQVTFNSWHEVSIQRFEAGDTLIQCLQHYLALLAAKPTTAPEFSAYCFSSARGPAIARRVEELFGDVVAAFFQEVDGPRALRYVIEMDRRWFILQFIGHQPRFLAVASIEELWRLMSVPQAEYAPVAIDRYALREYPELREVCAASQAGNVQVFYQVQGEVARLWLIDECGALFHWQVPFRGPALLLTPLVLFLTNVAERKQLRRALDQGDLMPEIRVSELSRDSHGFHHRRRSVTLDSMPADCVEIQAVGVRTEGQELLFDLFCDDREFTVLEHGDRVIEAMRHYLRSRVSGERTPAVAVTDISLEEGTELASGGDFQTAQYVRYKLALESALNRSAR